MTSLRNPKPDIENCVAQSFYELDKEIRGIHSIRQQGSTAALALIFGKRLVVANVGDTEACLVRKSRDGKLTTEVLTTAHLASEDQEGKRIRELGGTVFFGRVDGSLAVSRSFGDCQYKKPTAKEDFVSAIPAIRTVLLDETCAYLIVACDGLWDVVDKAEASALVDKYLKTGTSIQQVARELVQHALAKQSADNITVIVCELKWKSDRAGVDLAKPAAISQMPPDVRPNFGPSPILLQQAEAIPEYLASLSGVTLKGSYFYLGLQQEQFVREKLQKNWVLPCWGSQELISRVLFGEQGVNSLKITQQACGHYFVWATEFSNVHSTFVYTEKPIVIDGEMFPGMLISWSC